MPGNGGRVAAAAFGLLDDVVGVDADRAAPVWEASGWCALGLHPTTTDSALTSSAARRTVTSTSCRRRRKVVRGGCPHHGSLRRFPLADGRLVPLTVLGSAQILLRRRFRGSTLSAGADPAFVAPASRIKSETTLGR
jgi:hypothetical protein